MLVGRRILDDDGPWLGGAHPLPLSFRHALLCVALVRLVVGGLLLAAFVAVLGELGHLGVVIVRDDWRLVGVDDKAVAAMLRRRLD